MTVWEVETGQVLYKLPGHKGTVTAVDLHPRSVQYLEIMVELLLTLAENPSS